MSGMREWWRSGNVRDAWREHDVSEDAVEAVANEIAEAARWSIAGTLDLIGSPIEKKLLLALMGCRGEGVLMVPQSRTISVWAQGAAEPSVTRLGYDEKPYADVSIDCQRAVGKYRADFIVSWTNYDALGQVSASVAVEADGHDFHEKTKRQAEHDKKRDRFFAAQDLTLLRFTGSEIHRAPEKCAIEVFSVLWPKLHSAQEQEWLRRQGAK